MNAIYLDNNATTVIHPDVVDVMAKGLALGLANPASQHGPGRRARQLLEDARESLVRLLGGDVDRTDADRLIQTSGGTEANNLAIFGLASSRPGRILISAVEHPCVADAANHLRQCGREVLRIPVDANGVVDLAAIRLLLKEETCLVSIMLANHETGVLQPIDQVAALCRAAGVVLHCDAVQAVGKVDVDFKEMQVDAMTVSAHKFHGPVGFGALLMRHELPIEPTQFGGAQQLGLRPGTESVVLAMGAAKALELAVSNLSASATVMTRLRDQLEEGLLRRNASLVVNGKRASRLPQTSNISFPGCDRQALLMALDLHGVACSTGSACTSGSSEPSPVLEAMGLPTSLVEGAMRFSLSRMTTEEEVAQAVNRVIQVVGEEQLV